MTETLIQGSVEWLQARVGKVTASRVADVIAKTKSGWGASRKNYAAELVAERLTGVPAQQFVNAAMQWGVDNESLARDAYQFFHDVTVEEVGLIPHPAIPDSAASPDGYVGADGMVEIKCPNTATHIETILGQAVPAKYVTQMQWQMACSGRKWCDFVSFDPRMPEKLRLFVKRVVRDDAYIASLESMVREFLAEVNKDVAALLATAQKEAA
jgi:putative phage-type endonuclease